MVRVIGSCLGHSDREMIEFSFLGEVWNGVNKTTLNFWRTDFGLFRLLVERISWESVLKGIGVQESWMLLKKELLKAQD